MIFVTVGHQMPFDRLIAAVDAWAGARGRSDVFAQIGTTSLRPASFNAATTFDPIKPAPPVTSNMSVPALMIYRHLCPRPARRATWVSMW